jgi:Spy/CpxP family protein refolding chaperone
MEMMESLRNETAELNERAASLERRTFELLQENPAPEDSINKNLNELSSVRLEISKRVTKKFMEAKSFLTPEQQRMMFQEMSRGHHGPPLGGPGKEMPPFDRRPDH